MMHAARIGHSPRLRRVHRLLSDGSWHTTREIVQGAQVCAVNSCVAELREAGAEIACKVFTDEKKQRRFHYRMTKSAPAAKEKETAHDDR